MLAKFSSNGTKEGKYTYCSYDAQNGKYHHRA